MADTALLHTPGPWKSKDAAGKYDNRKNDWNVCDEEASCSEAAPITLKDGAIVAFAVHSENGYYSGSNAALDANARLIAAAPELLEACMYAVDNPNFDSGQLDKMCREAINKATQP